MEMDPGVLMSLMNQEENTGFEFIWVLLIFLIFGFGGGGLGRGLGGQSIPDIEAAVKAANCGQTQLGMLFDAVGGNREAISGLANSLGTSTQVLQQAINGLSNGICDLGYKMGMDSRDILSAIATGNSGLQAELAQCCCTTNRNIDSVRYDMSMMNTGIINAIDKCCCQTQLGLKDLGYQSATQACDIKNSMNSNFCELNSNLTNQITQLNYNQQQGFQSIINYLGCQETDKLKNELQAAQMQLSQISQTSALEKFILENCKSSTTPTTGA